MYVYALLRTNSPLLLTMVRDGDNDDDDGMATTAVMMAVLISIYFIPQVMT